MKTVAAELLFAAREDFRQWLEKNAASSDGVWLILGKTRAVATLSANDALEEALCFGWVDGQMKSIDQTKYRKYFARRRAQSPWSEKNKHMIDLLRNQGLMTELGERAVEAAMGNGMWDASPSGTLTDGQITAFTDKLSGFSPAFENFSAMPPSAKTAYVRRYFSSQNEQTRQKHFEAIVALLNQNQKPTIGGKNEAAGGSQESPTASKGE